MDGPNTPSWDPLPAALKWELTGKRRLKLLQTSSASTSTTSTDYCMSPDVGIVLHVHKDNSVYIGGNSSISEFHT